MPNISANCTISVKSCQVVFVNLNPAVGVVARMPKVLEMRIIFNIFFESSTHLYGEEKILKIICRFSALGVRSRLQLPDLG